ncbi:MAG TPA: hypothetical protein VG164_05800 [Trebonia sp.]|jgi:hypothetical protein|nr:hypothetical protein [Trebonia sp.]
MLLETGQRRKALAVDASRQLRAIAKIVLLDVAAPLAAYSALRAAGLTAVTALLLSGVFPACGVAAGIGRHRRLDVVGGVVLAGIVSGAVLGLISHSPRPVLVEGSVPTGAHKRKKG